MRQRGKSTPTPTTSPLAQALQQGPALGQLADKELIHALEARGYMILQDGQTERRVRLPAPTIGTVRWAVVTDTHLGSKWQQLTHWRDFYKVAAEFRAEFVIHCGDIVDGSQMRKGHEYEVFKHGADAQAKYAIEEMPVLRNRQKRALPTYILGGNHDEDFWKGAGANILRTISDNRDDITILGAPQALFTLGPLKIYCLHPRGGMAYARSYRLQKIVEQFAPDVKPNILLVGHYHVACHLPAYRNVEAFLCPCFQGQTPFLKTLGLAPVVGGLLLEATYSKRGLEQFKTHWVLYRTHLENDWP